MAIENYDFQIIANLMSGSGQTREVLEELKTFLDSHNKTYNLLIVEKPTVISLLPQNGYSVKEAVVCIGGDGTVAESIGYILNKNLSLPLAVIPTGTANFIADSFGINKNIFDFSFLLRKRIKRVDVGRANYGNKEKFYFMLGMGLGFEEKFLKITKEKSKGRFGVVSYILAALSELLSLKKIPVAVKYDGREIKTDVCTLLVLNTPPKILKIFPLFKNLSVAENNGILNLQYVEYKNYFYALIGTLFLHILGRVNFGLVKSIDAKEFVFESPALVGTQIDGELRGNLPLKVSVLPSSFDFLT